MTAQSVRVLSVIAPMTQLNTPYPSTAYLTGFLRSRGIDAVQEDLALALALALLSADGLAAVHAQIAALPARRRSPLATAFAERFERYRLRWIANDPFGFAAMNRMLGAQRESPEHLRHRYKVFSTGGFVRSRIHRGILDGCGCKTST